MRMIDSRLLDGGPRMTIQQIHAAGFRYTSNPIAFVSFYSGLQLNADRLKGFNLNGQTLMHGVGASGGHVFFSYVMHHVLPMMYSANHLANLGGRFALGIDGVGAYTMTLLNRRVVTLKGVPLDPDGRSSSDANIRADAFLALFNDALSRLTEDLSKTTQT